MLQRAHEIIFIQTNFGLLKYPFSVQQISIMRIYVSREAETRIDLKVMRSTESSYLAMSARQSQTPYHIL